MNIGKFQGKNDGQSGAKAPEFYTLSRKFIRKHHDATSAWEKVRLRCLQTESVSFKDEAGKDEDGFELVARKLGIPRPTRILTDR
jgi:hypothetical protein